MRSTIAETKNFRTRQKQILNEELGKRLLTYTLAAGASVAALSPKGIAEVIYTATRDSMVGNPNGMNIDLNHDGVIDFNVYSYDFSGVSYLQVHPKVSGNEVVFVSFSGEAAALSPGAYIGPAVKFSPNATLMAFGYPAVLSVGPWAYARKHYLGLEFMIGGKLHYGWARLNVGSDGAALTGYAYETVPNRPIQAGLTHSGDDFGTLVPQSLTPEGNSTLKNATLGLLAQGAPGLELWRRKETED